MAEQKADQQLRSSQQQQHQHGDCDGIGQRVLGEQVEQAGRARHDRQGASIAEGDVLRADHGGVAEPGVMLHCLPAAGVGGTSSARQASIALQHLDAARVGQRSLLRPLLKQARLLDCSLPGIGAACLLLGMQGEQH